MRRKIYSAFSPEAGLKDYFAQVTFAGFIGTENEYSAFAKNEDDAKEDIIQQAKEDLEVESVEDISEGEYEVTISFAGFIGADETYTVSADSEDEAEEAALDEAEWDLEIVELTSEE